MASEHATIIRRVFSTDADTPSAAEEPDAARPQRPLICNIGRGTCGTVYELGATNCAIKLGGDAEALVRDYRQTIKAWRAVREWGEAVAARFAARGVRVSIPRVPRCYEFHAGCADVVARHEGALASEDNSGSSDSGLSEIDGQERTNPGFIMERIPAIPRCAREALIKEVFNEEYQDHFLNDMDSIDCLIRVYFGEDLHDDDSVSDLRNFPLYSDQMDEIGLDTATLATELAAGLALVHWGTELDAMDSEFVLSSSSPHVPRSRMSSLDLAVGDAAEPKPDSTRRGTHLWILDFDKASHLELDDPHELVRQLFVAMIDNDPYFPRPEVNEERWLQFRQAYLKASEVVLAARAARGDPVHELLPLPEQLMDALQHHGVGDAGRPEDLDIVFAD